MDGVGLCGSPHKGSLDQPFDWPELFVCLLESPSKENTPSKLFTLLPKFIVFSSSINELTNESFDDTLSLADVAFVLDDDDCCCCCCMAVKFFGESSGASCYGHG